MPSHTIIYDANNIGTLSPADLAAGGVLLLANDSTLSTLVSLLRADLTTTSTAVSNITTSNVPEGSRLYHTAGRAAAAAPVQSVNGSTGAVTITAASLSAYTTTQTDALLSTVNTSVAGKLAKASNLSDLTSASAARANLALGTVAVLNVGTSNGQVPTYGASGLFAPPGNVTLAAGGKSIYGGGDGQIGGFATLAVGAIESNTVVAASITADTVVVNTSLEMQGNSINNVNVIQNPDGEQIYNWEGGDNFFFGQFSGNHYGDGSPLTGLPTDCGITIGNGSTVITTGTKGPTRIKATSTITKWRVDADATSTLSIAVYVNGTLISASAPMTLTAGTSNSDISLTGWTKNVTKDDAITFAVNSISGAKRITITLYGVTR